MSKYCRCPPFDCRSAVGRYLAGDQSAADLLHAHLTPLVRAVVTRIIGPDRAQDWEDVAQEAFARVFLRLDTWRSECPFCDWLAVVVARCAISHRRRLSRRRAEVVVPVARVEGPGRDCDLATLECIELTIAEFKPDWRRVMELRRDGVGTKEIAEQLGKSERTVRHWLSLMYDKLARSLWD